MEIVSFYWCYDFGFYWQWFVFYKLGLSNQKNDLEEKNTNEKECENIIDDEFIIKFETNGGNSIEQITVCVSCIEDANKDLPIPVKSKMEFDGWFYDKELINKVEADNSGNVIKEQEFDDNNCFKKYKDIILYAKWSEKETTVSKPSNNTTNKPSSNANNKPTNNSTSKPQQKVEYYCIDPDAKLNGKYCETTIEVFATEKYGCESPYVLGYNDWCWLYSSTAAKVTTDGSYYRCPSSYSENSGKNDGICYKFDTQDVYYVCPSGYTLIRQQMGLTNIRYICRYVQKTPANTR